jgi:predicted nucleotidyltransferase
LAREEETTQSDIDLMVVGDATHDEVLSRLSAERFKNLQQQENKSSYDVAGALSDQGSGRDAKAGNWTER